MAMTSPGWGPCGPGSPMMRATADALRDELQAAGYDVKTTKDGTVAIKRLA